MAAEALQADVIKETPATAVVIREDSQRHAGGRPIKLNVDPSDPRSVLGEATIRFSDRGRGTLAQPTPYPLKM
jgi:hypothetical protein